MVWKLNRKQYSVCMKILDPVLQLNMITDIFKGKVVLTDLIFGLCQSLSELKLTVACAYMFLRCW